MTARVSADPLRLSIVLATDTYETLRPVIQCLRRQIDQDHLEIVIIAPGENLERIDSSQLAGFGAVRVVAISTPLSLPRARAAGVRAASAPMVFIGETHCFPEPDMCNRLLAGFTDERCAAVVPAIVNANPTTALSWASYLTDYGVWGPGRASGRLEQTLKYNGAYRRDVLLELGDRLDELLDANNEELWPILQRRGYYSCFDCNARTNHVNATKLRAMMRIRFFAGALIGAQRARRWTWVRRVTYVIGSPLIPVVLVWRARSNIRFGAPGQRLPLGTTLGISVGALMKTIGEVLGYLGLTPSQAEISLTDNELHKLRHASFPAP
jgi:Glycosyl transferase family 2